MGQIFSPSADDISGPQSFEWTFYKVLEQDVHISVSNAVNWDRGDGSF